MLNEDRDSSEEANGSCPAWKFRCSVARCPYRTNRPFNLSRHEESHAGITEPKLYGCPVCIYSTDKASNLKRHVSLKHPASKKGLPDTPHQHRNVKMQCQVMGCRYETNRPYDLKRHLMVHNNPEKSHRTFKCSLCTYSSDRKANLKRHHELRHSGIEEAVQTAEELRQEMLLEKQMLKQKVQKLKDQQLKQRHTKQQMLEDQIIEVPMLKKQVEHGNIPLPAKNKILPVLPKAKEAILSSVIEKHVKNEHEEENEEYVYEELQEEQPPIITICKPQIIHGDISDKHVIAVNVNGQLRWFQAIDPPPGAPTKLDMPMRNPSISAQQQMDELDDELALSLAEEDHQDEFLERMLSEEKPHEGKQSPPPELTWSWSTPDAVHHISPTVEDKEELRTDDADTDFPDWWDDGKYTKMHKNQIFANHSKKPSQANVQRILRIIYDVYYKPFKEDRKQFEAFQIKDSWLSATRMTRMQIVKDMYSKQGT
ncbi:RE1-silencing transcription factor A [Drosophila yakuba]|uniref:C2H2-type domain-containing protein n=1 Tax=Drosophila yakuba TaxID=7245 RepID=B4P9C3_DROYA|nr:RE1-silencing transcription factor A [Drosophila yakuba]EDW90252.1 uncharacterized protein Dyak_GE12751 [Drosophila yakuba]